MNIDQRANHGYMPPPLSIAIGLWPFIGALSPEWRGPNSISKRRVNLEAFAEVLDRRLLNRTLCCFVPKQQHRASK
jgi:hypothetical protein